MAVSADIYTERDQFSKPVALSIGLHVALFGGMLLYATLLGRVGGESWGGIGGGGGAMSATLVSSIPLPNRQPESENILANESKGLTKSLPKVEEKPDVKSIPIPARDAKKLDKVARTTPQEKKPPQPVETATNVIPFGQGGPVSGPYGSFSAGGAKGGFGFNGGGDFGSRYAYYVDAVRRKVSEYWLKYEVDPNIHDARRVYITFEISRNGQPSRIQVEQSSGVPSLDQSAVRALQRIDTFGPLPPDYRGNSVNVEFWFDYRR